MTSTVIDVALFLLCVSAGVVTLTGASDLGATGTDTEGPDAGAVADLVATSTASVTYDPSPSTDDDEMTLTHHATLAELLATAAGAAAGDRTVESSVSSRSTSEAYQTAVAQAVRSAVGTRTQIVAYRSTSSTADVLGAEAVDNAIVVGESPPSDGAIDVATIRLPVFQPESGDPDRVRAHREDRAENHPQYAGVRIVVRVW